MWMIKAGTTIQIFAPFGRIASSSSSYNEKTETTYTDTSPWKAYTTTEDKIYEKEQVWDTVALFNGREDVPHWARRNIEERGKFVIHTVNSKGKVCYAMCNPSQIYYLD